MLQDFVWLDCRSMIEQTKNMRGWKTEADLAALLLARSAAGRKVVLSPETAHFVGLKLMTASAKPTRDEVAKLICASKCAAPPCYGCRGLANIIVHAYGQSVDSAG